MYMCARVHMPMSMFMLALMLVSACMRVRRALGRAVRAAAPRARSAVRMLVLAPPRAHGILYVAYRHDTPHGMACPPVFINTNNPVFLNAN